jgi:hypothetical protein
MMKLTRSARLPTSSIKLGFVIFRAKHSMRLRACLMIPTLGMTLIVLNFGALRHLVSDPTPDIDDRIPGIASFYTLGFLDDFIRRDRRFLEILGIVFEEID